MAEAIGPGTMLVCVKFSRPFEGDNGPTCGDLTVGAIYRCRKVHTVQDIDVYPCPWDGCGAEAFLLEDRFCDCFNMWLPYCPNLFRPLNDGDTSLVEKECERDHSYAHDLVKDMELIDV